jgi:hypothetical protein
MAAPTSHKLHNAHYHPIKVTEKWAAFMAEMEAGATRVVTERDRKRRERHNETTYARGTTGGS